jgi:hypothetical protein
VAKPDDFLVQLQGNRGYMPNGLQNVRIVKFVFDWLRLRAQSRTITRDMSRNNRRDHKRTMAGADVLYAGSSPYQCPSSTKAVDLHYA